MIVNKVVVGPLETNCYLIIKDNKVLIIDPGDDFLKIKQEIGNRKVVGVIVTHNHFDHIGALDECINYYKIDKYDISNLDEGKNQLDDFVFDVIYTPGHKEDLISIYFDQDKMLFCGDFIFENSIGRCDLPGGDFSKMILSITNILKLDNDTTIYPGHGNTTSIAKERNNLEEYTKFF